MHIEEILIIKNGSESYGISTENISQISRVPLLMQLPLRPFGMRGLCAVHGHIVTMLDMNLLLDIEEVDYDNDKTRLIGLNGQFSASTLLVSEVYSTVVIDEKNIEYTEEENDPVIAIYKHKNTLVQVLSLELLFSKLDKIHMKPKEIKNGKTKLEAVREEDAIRFLVFLMGNEQYSLNIDYLKEIIFANREYTDVAGSSDEVLGLITLRDELLLVIDLRKHYSVVGNNGDKNRILIVSHKGKKIGLLIDEIIDIQYHLVKDIEYMDESFRKNKIAGVIHGKDSLISFFDSFVLNNLFEDNKSFIDEESEKKNTKALTNTDMNVIIFKLLDKEYSFEIKKVAEIIDFIDYTPMVFTDDSIDGIINIRGEIIPVVSLFNILKIESKVTEESKIIICEKDNIKLGFMVDSVSDILTIKTEQIKEQKDEFFQNVLHLEDGKRLVLSMDIDKIMSTREV